MNRVVSPVLTCLARAHHGLPAEPMYHRLASALEHGVRRGEVLAGTAVPAETTMAGHLRVSRGTIRQALGLLEQRHVVARPPGAGRGRPRTRRITTPHEELDA
ncbi:MAG: GntR family transcriptional regulator [Nocardioidaceae bacterium]|nr:GntR family transcriptional regulator [Nocardioidaceae bacterium]